MNILDVAYTIIGNQNFSNESTQKSKRTPEDLILNWEQTGLNIVPVAGQTMANEGSKRVEINGIDRKRQITYT